MLTAYFAPLTRRAAIFNPCTREVRFLPLFNYYSLGFEPEEKKYKVFLRTLGQENCSDWIFTLGIDKS